LGVLLAGGGSANMPNVSNMPPLLFALQANDANVAAVLIRYGAVANVYRGDGMTALHMAVANNNPKTCMQLLAGGAHVNQVDATGAAPITHAMATEYRLVYDILEAAGGREAVVLGHTLLRAAVAGSHERVASQLAAGVSVNLVDRAGRTPLWYAAQSGHAHTVQQLMRAGGAVNQADQQRTTPLMAAIYANALPAVAALLEGGASTSLANTSRNTPLHAACSMASKDIVLTLLTAGADPTVRNDAGKWPIQVLPNTRTAPISGDPIKEAIVDALQTAMFAIVRLRGDTSLQGTLRESKRSLLLPATAEEAITSDQVAAATLDPSRVQWTRRADGQRLRLGGGTFGSVYAGVLADQHVALKHVTVAAQSSNVEAHEASEDLAFWREVVLQHRCTHDNVVRCLGGFVEHVEGRISRWMVLELCSGSLCDAVHGSKDKTTGVRSHGAAGPPSLQQRQLWMLQAVEGLAYLHR
jgi:ankyrin repeat protein